jgi:general nucleoside transport system permease protein
MSEAQFAVFLASSLRLAMPLILSATGEMVSELAGVLNLSLEGMMLSAAFGAFLGAWLTGNVVVGLVFGIVVALVFALLQAVLSVSLDANQIVAGLGLNILALGATTYLYRVIFGPLSRITVTGFDAWHVPVLEQVPVLGIALFQQIGPVYVGLAIVVLTWVALRHTAWGLAIRAVGENPRAADQAGVSVNLLRYGAVLFAGAMSGFAGAFLSIGDVHSFTEGMSAGRGYLAIVAVIFGRWTGWRVVAACLLFGVATALQFQASVFGLEIPTALLVMMPYLLAILAVAGLVGRHRPPAALTMPFIRGG